MQLRINDQRYEVAESPDRSLLWILRDELGLIGTRYGCGAGLCGACVVHVDGQAARSCQTLLSDLEGKQVGTIEGLAASHAGGDGLHPLQAAFLEHQVPQCGWCMSGQIMQAAALLAEDPEADERALLEGLRENLCRCGTYVRIRAAVLDAAARMREELRS